MSKLKKVSPEKFERLVMGQYFAGRGAETLGVSVETIRVNAPAYYMWNAKVMHLQVKSSMFFGTDGAGDAPELKVLEVLIKDVIEKSQPKILQ